MTLSAFCAKAFARLSRLSGLKMPFVIRKGMSVASFSSAEIVKKSFQDGSSTRMKFENFDGSISHKEFRKRTAYILIHTNLDLKTGMFFNNRNIYIRESSSWQNDSIIASRIPCSPIFYKDLNFNEKIFLPLPTNGFYHWLIEDLPPVINYINKNQTLDINLAIWEDSPKYVKDFASNSEVPFVTFPRFVSLSNVALLERFPTTGWPDPRDISALIDFFNTFIETKEPSLKLFVSRLHSSRSPKFESALLRILTEFGWQVLFLENLSLPEQIAIVSKAKVLAGIHGAGLASMTWMREQTKVIELMPHGRDVDCFSRLAQVKKLDFIRLSFDEGVSTVPLEIQRYLTS